MYINGGVFTSSSKQPPVNLRGLNARSMNNNTTNFKSFISNVGKDETSGSFTIESISKEGIFVKFTNGRVTKVNHLQKNMNNFQWNDAGDSFTLSGNWRSFERDGITLFTDKADKPINEGLQSATW